MTRNRAGIAKARRTRIIRAADSLAGDLGSLGASVGPRRGPGKRTQPDFLLRRPGGSSPGIEGTEAGDERYRRRLTGTEAIGASGEAIHLPFAPSTPATANEPIRAILREVRKYGDGSYPIADACHDQCRPGER